MHRLNLVTSYLVIRKRICEEGRIIYEHVNMTLTLGRRGSRNFRQGGVHISKNFDKQKKKKKKNGKRENGIKTRVVVVLSLSQKLDFQTDFYRQLFKYKFFFGRACFLYNCKPLPTQIHR